MLAYTPPLRFRFNSCQKTCSSTLVLLLTDTDEQMVKAEGRSEGGSVAREAQSVISSSAPNAGPPSPIPSTTEIEVACTKVVDQTRTRPNRQAREECDILAGQNDIYQNVCIIDILYLSQQRTYYLLTIQLVFTQNHCQK